MLRHASGAASERALRLPAEQSPNRLQVARFYGSDLQRLGFAELLEEEGAEETPAAAQQR